MLSAWSSPVIDLTQNRIPSSRSYMMLCRAISPRRTPTSSSTNSSVQYSSIPFLRPRNSDYRSLLWAPIHIHSPCKTSYRKSCSLPPSSKCLRTLLLHVYRPLYCTSDPRLPSTRYRTLRRSLSARCSFSNLQLRETYRSRMRDLIQEYLRQLI